MITFESDSFEASLRKANEILRVTGLQTDDEENNLTLLERHWNRKLFWFFNIVLYSGMLGELAWLVVKGLMESNFIEVTFTAPCATLSLLSSAKVHYRIKYGHHINDLIHSLRRLQTNQSDSGIHTDPVAFNAIRNTVGKLNLAIKVLTIINSTLLVAFFLGPFIIMGFIYHNTGELQLIYPLLILYPFDAFDLRICPFVYAHQMISGAFTVFAIFGPDCLYYIICTFVQVQFCSLQYDFERIVAPSTGLRLQKADETYQKKFTAYVSRHRELIRCCHLIETVYSKSALFNFMSSSLLLCLAGFNIMAYGDLVMSINFLSFLSMCLMQIYLICDYGDKLSETSVALSSAVYNSKWYNVDAKTAKGLLMILTRAQRPCKLTAYTLSEINLGAFTRILSTSWSYFALLQSVYKRKQVLTNKPY